MKAGEGSGERPAWGRSGWAGAAGPPRGRRCAGVRSPLLLGSTGVGSGRFSLDRSLPSPPLGVSSIGGSRHAFHFTGLQGR